ncbi:hypothetical protein KBP53_03505 [Corynebacterium genitalium ATCC 33030]|uniref:hypothetical protein n=1 Tax=Corynebacterium genitalium TaxID=38288 RepID=UPI0012EACA52|nr:hypothetical protein [Corynebacterium genitalium]UUA90033.1 hypothetical protein KBP53_03505 [Corynebacterium genitalium ATCC 33030]
MGYTKLACVDRMAISRRVPGTLNRTGGGIQVSSGFFASDFPVRSPELARHDARFHPHNTAYRVPAGLRAVAHAHENPNCVVAGLSALALLGFPYLADSCDTTMNTPVDRREREWGLVRRRRKAKGTWTVIWNGLEIPVSAPADAVVEAVQDVRAGIHSWSSPAWVADPIVLWAVQLVDASRHLLGVTPESILDAARGRVDNRWLRNVLQLSSARAESPKETEMRLMCTALTEKPNLIGDTEWAQAAREFGSHGLAFTEQVPLYDGPRLITTFDLALTDLKIALMYDGEHHLARGQRDTDFRINLECQLMGWTVVRISAGTLYDLPRILLALLRERA